jgi:hypothetical protein
MARPRQLKKHAAPTPADPNHIQQLIEWTLCGANEHDIRAAAAAKLKLTDEQIDRHLVAVAEYYATIGSTPSHSWRGLALLAYREIYRKALEIGDYAIAIRAMERLEIAADRIPGDDAPTGAPTDT